MNTPYRFEPEKSLLQHVKHKTWFQRNKHFIIPLGISAAALTGLGAYREYEKMAAARSVFFPEPVGKDFDYGTTLVRAVKDANFEKIPYQPIPFSLVRPVSSSSSMESPMPSPRNLVTIEDEPDVEQLKPLLSLPPTPRYPPNISDLSGVSDLPQSPYPLMLPGPLAPPVYLPSPQPIVNVIDTNSTDNMIEEQMSTLRSSPSTIQPVTSVTAHKIIPIIFSHINDLAIRKYLENKLTTLLETGGGAFANLDDARDYVSVVNIGIPKRSADSLENFYKKIIEGKAKPVKITTKSSRLDRRKNELIKMRDDPDVASADILRLLRLSDSGSMPKGDEAIQYYVPTDILGQYGIRYGNL